MSSPISRATIASSLAFSVEPGLLDGAGLFVAVEGKAAVIRDKAQFKAHWTPDLEVWFQQGIDTPGLVLLQVHARRIKYWEGEEEGEIEARRLIRACPCE